MSNKILLFLLTLIPSILLGWGKGHNLHIEWVLNYLPSEIQNFWNNEQKEQMIKHWSHYPDGPAYKKYNISTEEATIMGDDYDYIKLATNGGIRDHLHHPNSKGVMFFALAKAFRENRSDAAAIYAGALLHSYADGGAFNHGSVMHYLFYTRYKHVKYPKLWHKDLWDIHNGGKILKNARSLIGDFKVNSKTKNLEDALIDVMMSGVISTKFLSGVEADIGKVNSDGSASKESTDAIIKTLAYQTMEGANIINQAWLIAKSKQSLDPSKLDIAWTKKSISQRPIYAKFKKLESDYFKARDPRDDNVYKGLWDNKKYPAIGFVAEAAYDMSLGELGFGSRFATAIIARGMKKSGTNVELFSFDNLEKNPPDVKKIPVLIIHAKNGVPARIKKSVGAYLDNGGNLLFIGGYDEGLTGLTLKKRPVSEVPVVLLKYIKDSKVDKMKIELLSFFSKISKKKQLKFKDNPSKTGAWNKAFADYEIVPDKNTTPLMNLILPDGSKYCVGAAQKVNGKYKYVFLPAYAFLPFMFSEDTKMEDWSEATTDSFGNTLAKESTKLLLKK